jgi:hypothetical protein
MPSAAAADVNAEFVSAGLETAFQGTDDAGRDSGRMPIHAHDGAE